MGELLDIPLRGIGVPASLDRSLVDGSYRRHPGTAGPRPGVGQFLLPEDGATGGVL